jgi:hypothetical protein
MSKRILLTFFVVLLTASFVSGDIVTDGLVVEMDASQPGSQPGTAWKPAIGAGSGILVGKPEAGVDDNGDGTYSHYYSFDDSGTDFDEVTNVAGNAELDFMELGDATIEAWVRISEAPDNPKTKSIVFGNTDPADSGMRLVMRDDGSGSSWGVTFLQRDNETANTPWEGAFHWHAGYTQSYSATDWAHIVFKKHAATYGGNSISIGGEVYINGKKLLGQTKTSAASGLSDLYLVPDDYSIGTFRSDMNLENSDVGVVRAYNRLLSEPEITQNYDAGFAVPEPTTICLLGFGVLVSFRKRK